MYPTLFTTPGVKQFAEEIDAERQRQLKKFGEQHHPDGTGLPIYAHAANRYRDAADRNAAAGVLAWRDVLLEEVYEALAEKETGPLRDELLQVAAVCAAWIADIDSRGTAAEQPAAGARTTCGNCERSFDATDSRFDGHARHSDTPYCRRCVDRCHEATDAFHRCVICA
jgi:hypothetical protein